MYSDENGFDKKVTADRVLHPSPLRESDGNTDVQWKRQPILYEDFSEVSETFA